MTTTGPGFLKERKQQLAELSLVQNAHLALAVTERAIQEAEVLTGTSREEMPPIGLALEAYWKLLEAGNTVLDDDLKHYHKKLVDLLPRDEEDDCPPHAWYSALNCIALSCMVLVDPKKAGDYAASTCGEIIQSLSAYYLDNGASRVGEIEWQDRALALVKNHLPKRQEFLELADYPRGEWEEAD